MTNQNHKDELNNAKVQLLQHRDSNMLNPYLKNRNVYTRQSSILICMSIFLIIASTVISILYQHDIFNFSLDAQHSIQQHMDNETLKVFMNIISNFVNPNIVVGILVLIFAFSRKKFEILNFLLYFAFVSYICAILKTLFSSPRPYWVGQKVQQWEWVCYQEYGNPSGHSFLGPIFYEFILRNYILRKISKDNSIGRFVATAGIIILVSLILFCRLYLGMHALNQVFYGLILGISFVILYRCYFELTIKRVLLYLVRCNIDKTKRPRACIYVLTSFFAALFICINIYIFQEYVMNKSGEFVWQFEIEVKCKINQLDPLKAFYNRCFIDCSGVCICFSMMLGFLYSKHPEFLLGRYLNKSNVFLRSLVITITTLFFMIGFIFLPSDEIVPLKFLFQSIGVFTAGICLIYLAPLIMFKYQMIIPIHKELLAELNEELKDSNQTNDGVQFQLNQYVQNNHESDDEHDIDFQNEYDKYMPKGKLNKSGNHVQEQSKNHSIQDQPDDYDFKDSDEGIIRNKVFSQSKNFQ